MDRITEGLCPLFGSCGGCRYDGLDYAAELKQKEEKIRKLFLPLLGEAFFGSPAYEGVIPSPQPAAYRNKMEFSFGNAEKDGPLTLGLHQKKSFYNVLSVEHCRLVHEDLNRIVRAVQAYFRETGTPFYHKQTHMGLLRHLILRRSETEGTLLVNLVTAFGMKKEVLDGFVRILEALPLEGRLAGILHTENDSLSDAVVPQKVTLLRGEAVLKERILGMEFEISPFSFFQTNTRAAEKLYEKAREYIALTPGSLVYDLYSGTGTIGQILAPVAGRVCGVEIVEEAVAAARKNAAANGLFNCEFLAGDVLRLMDSLPAGPDYIVVDPPRDGIHPKALARLSRSGAKRIVYISCKASSLARDLPMLELGGYRAEKMALADLFPGTDNIECVMMLSGRGSYVER